MYEYDLRRGRPVRLSHGSMVSRVGALEGVTPIVVYRKFLRTHGVSEPVLLRQRVHQLGKNLVSDDGLGEIVTVICQAAES